MMYFLLLSLSVLCWYVFPYLAKKGATYLLLRRCRARRSICLTYDDGPSTTLTPRLISLLQAHSAKATFFPTGFWQSKFHGLAAIVQSAGHEVGSHSFAHLHAWKRSPISVFRDIQAGLSLAEEFGSSRLFRPPFGKVTVATLLQVWFKGFRFGWWTIDSSDTWRERKPISRVLQEVRMAGGGVVLMHDHSRPNSPEDESYVTDLTDAILNMARLEKYKVCTLGELASR